MVKVIAVLSLEDAQKANAQIISRVVDVDESIGTDAGTEEVHERQLPTVEEIEAMKPAEVEAALQQLMGELYKKTAAKTLKGALTALAVIVEGDAATVSPAAVKYLAECYGVEDIDSLSVEELIEKITEVLSASGEEDGEGAAADAGDESSEEDAGPWAPYLSEAINEAAAGVYASVMEEISDEDKAATVANFVAHHAAALEAGIEDEAVRELTETMVEHLNNEEVSIADRAFFMCAICTGDSGDGYDETSAYLHEGVPFFYGVPMIPYTGDLKLEHEGTAVEIKSEYAGNESVIPYTTTTHGPKFFGFVPEDGSLVELTIKKAVAAVGKKPAIAGKPGIGKPAAKPAAAAAPASKPKVSIGGKK